MTTSRVETLRVEYRRDSAFVASANPRVSWVVETSVPDWEQISAELRLDGAEVAALDGESNAFVEWPFAPLRAHDSHTIEVRVRGSDGWTPWSDALHVRSAVLADGEWVAPFIGMLAPSEIAQPVVLRRELDLDADAVSAVLHVAALGASRITIDGTSVDDTVLGPGWTSYADRVVYDTVDVTALLTAGRHVIEIDLTGAWYTEEYGFGESGTRTWGEQPSVAVQLHIRDGASTERVVATDSAWQVRPHPSILASGIYAGERIDRRVLTEHPWHTPEQRDYAVVPTPRLSEPVRRVQEIKIADTLTTPSGALVLDFGQNLVGRLRLNVTGPRGTRIVLHHAEVLDQGELALGPLRRAAAMDEFILSGTGGPETFEPIGTFHGFRFTQIDGWPGEFDPADVAAVVLHSDMTRTGWFETSHELLSRLHENVVWSMRGNFLSIPSDCPQRDERLGWTGDAQIFAPTAATLFDCGGFLRSWLTDLAGDQKRHRGTVPLVVPDALGFPAAPTAAWGDAATVVPSVLSDRFADDGVLAAQYVSMRDWVDVVLADATPEGLWESRMQLGDWLEPDSPPDQPGASKTDKDLVASAYLVRSVSLLADAATRLGKREDAEHYGEVARRAAATFRATFITPAGRMSSDAPTAYALALGFGLVEEPSARQALGDRLAALVRRRAYRISTGFIGTPLILDALVDTGHTAVAGRLLLQTGCPSWLYPLTMGATTVWERWDSLLEDGSLNPGEMTSFNHYGLGAVADWMHRRLAGVAPVDRGYRRMRFAPVPLMGVPSAWSTIDTVSGRIRGGWEREGDDVMFELRVPAHTRAIVELPDQSRFEVGSGLHRWAVTLPETPAPVDEVTLMTPMRRIVDDDEAFDAVLGALRAVDPSLPSLVAARSDWNSESPFMATMFSLPGQAIGAIAAAFSEISARRQQSCRTGAVPMERM
jgi:alpha-L-rhamnosidase